MKKPQIPPVPPGTGAAGRRLWRSVLGQFELEEHERVLLTEAIRLADRLDALHKVVENDGEVVKTMNGVKVHPALVEARQSAIALARVMAALRLPDESDRAGQPQRRVGVRGTYRLAAVK